MTWQAHSVAARGRRTQLRATTSLARRARERAATCRVKEVLVEGSLPAHGVELAEELIASVHVLHGTQLRLPRLRQPGVSVDPCPHGRFRLLQSALQRRHQARDLQRSALPRLPRPREQLLHEQQHAVVRLLAQLSHAPRAGKYAKPSPARIPAGLWAQIARER